jgi:hypothetical protein
MPEIQIAPLQERLSDQDITDLASALERSGAPAMPKADEAGTASINDALDAEGLEELMDRLEAHDLACDIYLPIEFEGRVEVGGMRVGSAQALFDLLEELKDEILEGEEEDEDEEEDEEEEEDDDYGRDLIEREVRLCFQALYAGAQAAIERHLPLHVQG